MSVDLPEASRSPESIEIFYSYAQRDKTLCDELESHLGALKQQRLIRGWHNRDIQIGTDWMQTVDLHLDSANIILLLISSDFINSDYCYSIEMQRALERHKQGKARVIPIILRAVDLEGTPIASLRVLPTGGKPITSWSNRDEAFKDVSKGIRTVVQELKIASATYPLPFSKKNELPLNYNELIQTKSWPSYYETIDTQEAIKLFQELVLSDSKIRVLRLSGEANMGKSHLLTKVFPTLIQQDNSMLYSVLDMRNPMYEVPDILQLACDSLGITQFGRYREARETWNSRLSRGKFRQDSANDIRTRDRDLTYQFLQDISNQTDRLFLFFFDTVNDANDYMQTWLTDTFLAHVSQIAHIRTVIAGRSLPKVHGSYAIWYRDHSLQAVTNTEDFVLYCRKLRARLGDQSVRDFADACDYVPGIFVDLVYPKFIKSRISND